MSGLGPASNITGLESGYRLEREVAAQIVTLRPFA